MTAVKQHTRDRVIRSVAEHAPTSVRAAARRMIKGRLDLPAVVARKGRLSRWVGFNVLRLYRPPSLVSRTSRLSEWIAVNLRHELPTLYHFDVHLTDHCNLNCKGCIHFSSICKPWFVDPERFADDMDAMSRRLNVSQIFLLGGEPLLHPEVAVLLGTARRCFPRSRICVVTNGVLLMGMGEEFWRTMAEEQVVLICEAYPIGLPNEAITARAAEYGVSLEWTGEGATFYKLPIDVTGSQDPADSFRRCEGITNCPLYKDGRLYPCAYPPYVHALSERFGLDGLQVLGADSISIRDHDSEAIVDFLRRPVPFCRYCDFDHFDEYAWTRGTDRTVDEWTVGCDADA